MSSEIEATPNPRRIWPWLALAAVGLAVGLAIVWVRAEVRRVREFQDMTYLGAAPATNDLLAGFREALTGGDAVAGRNIFFNKPEASCGKCHRAGGEGGDNGPALDGIGSRATREFILESMVAPNASIAKGYETVIVLLKDGSGRAGVLRQETATNLVIHTPDDGSVTILKRDVTQHAAGASPMPADFAKLITKPELRDLAAFVASLTTNAPAAK